MLGLEGLVLGDCTKGLLLLIFLYFFIVGLVFIFCEVGTFIRGR